MRPVRRRIVIICDDTETAVAYFEVLKQEVEKTVILDVRRACRHGATPTQLWQQAGEAAIEIGDPDEGDAIWVLLDLEADNSRRREAAAIKEKSQNHGVIKVALSDPCFEVWTLAHFADTGGAVHDCATITARVKKEWQRHFKETISKKSQADYAKLSPLRPRAISNAQKHHQRGDPSYTEIYIVVDHILK